ncbi:MAG: diaminopropionate ammonia-lyase [Aminipila sp.]
MQAIEILMNNPIEYSNESELPINFDDVYRFHKSIKEYEKTPLHSLKSLAAQLHVKEIYVKDESYRFGLNAFKGLGVSYALNEIIKNNPQEEYTFVSCTDGNHGKALAWRANRLGHKAIIFMPKGSESRRVKAIEQHHAKVFVTQMNYDDTVRYAAEYAKEHNYYLIQDTALPDYTEVPNNIVLGYSTMIHEALEQMSERPTHIFLQAGVGSMAGGVLWYLYNRFAEELPFIGVIEASSVACIYDSIEQKKMISIGGEPYTVMAGLNCGEANFTTFPLLKAKCNCFIKCRDEVTVQGMFRAKNPIKNDCSFSSGESGAVGLGFVEEILSNPYYSAQKNQLNLNSNSVILVFNTEGEIKSN